MSVYIVATIKPWNIDAFSRHTKTLPGEFYLVTEPEELTDDLIARLKPRYIFFMHWSWIVPDSTLNSTECVCFHMTDVPYGRGGSPLQNLIARGHKDTILTALRMTAELDAGPVYLKRPLSLAGRAQDIFERSADLVYDLIREIIEKEPQPVAQQGEAVIFRRRTPDMSKMPESGDLETLYNHIRMLDADTYPKAFLDYGTFRLSFDNAVPQKDGSLKARVKIETRK